MKKTLAIFILSALSLLALCACGSTTQITADAAGPEEPANTMNNTAQNTSLPQNTSSPFLTSTPISEVINDPAFDGYGRLIFPVDTGYYSGNTLGELRLTWYNNIDPDIEKKMLI